MCPFNFDKDRCSDEITRYSIRNRQSHVRNLSLASFVQYLSLEKNYYEKKFLSH
jgi:hypothetical protein